MGFISSASTVTVQARLTKAGKKKLYDSIESQSGQFITRFSLGDSDANYVAIDNGSGALSSGHVPEAGDYIPKPRSSVLYNGSFRPGSPMVFHNGSPGPETDATISINGSNQSVWTYAITTQWPKGEDFAEEYWTELKNPLNINEDRFRSAFTIRMVNRNTLELTYHADNLTLVDIIQLVGNGAGETDFHINITGKESRRFSRIKFRVVA